MPTISDLRQRQALPLPAKVRMTETRIREWYEHFDGNVYVSFSGGKDSTVLAHLVHGLYPEVPLVFSNTGLEYPEIQSFARKMGAEFVRPKKTFSEVVSTFGYPLISKRVAANIKTARIIRNANGGISEEEKKAEKGLPTRRGSLIGADTKLYDTKKWRKLCENSCFLIGADCCDELKKAQ